MTQNSPLQPATARRRFAPIFIVLGVLLVTIFIMPDLFAQDGDADAPAKKTGLSYIKDAGLWMVPLGICSMATIALVVYNFMQLTTTKFAPVELRMALLDHMQNCRVRSAIEVSSTSPTYLGRMSSTSLPHVDATEPETLGREAVEDAFSTLSVSGGADPSALAGDIGLAMVTTASGLIIAIPAVFFFFFFKNRLNKMVADCHLAASDMMDASIAAVNADQQMAKVPEGLQPG
jgi:biopolymer transport protein ExbB